MLGPLAGIVDAKEYFSLNEVRLKNGAVVINVDADWGKDTQVATLFIKNGAALKFDRKTSFPALAFRLLSYRLERLAKAEGFIVRSEFTWDYSAFILYLPKGYLEQNSSSLWTAVFGQNEVDSIELENLKRDVLKSLKKDLNRKYSKMPLVSLMSPNNSIYSLGLYGNEDDLSSINEKEFNEFLRCYLNPLGMVFVSSGLSKTALQYVSKELERNKPCFRDDRFFSEMLTTSGLAIKKVNYAKASGNNTVLRIGFPSASCSDKSTVVYDLLGRLISRDKQISSIGRTVYAYNNCYVGGGIFEIIIGGTKTTDVEDLLNLVLKRLSILGKNLDDTALVASKNDVKGSYRDILNKRDTLLFLIGQAKLFYGDPKAVLKYMDSIDGVKLYEARKVLTGLKENRSYCVMIKLEG